MRATRSEGAGQSRARRDRLPDATPDHHAQIFPRRTADAHAPLHDNACRAGAQVTRNMASLILLSVLAVKPCPNGCSLRGTCNGGVCSCYPNWTGDDCSTSACPNDCSKKGAPIKSPHALPPAALLSPPTRVPLFRLLQRR